MAQPATTKSWWQYARWLECIGRNMRITNPTGAELTACRTFLKLIWNPMTQTGTRPWLQDEFVKRAGNAGYQCNIDTEQAPVIVELLVCVASDMVHQPLSDAEGALIDTLITATGNRRYGTGPYFGGVAGSLVA